jgi:hypothetical protein
MTKGKRKHIWVKQLRCALKRNPEFFSYMSNGKKPYNGNKGFIFRYMKEYDIYE